MSNVTVFKNLGHINVLDYGAQPIAGFDNTTAFQNAFNVARDRQEHARVYVPPGVFEFEPVALGGARFLFENRAWFYLEGAGYGLTTLKFNTANAPCTFIALRNIANVEIHGITFDNNCNEPTIYNEAVHVRSSQRVNLFRNRFTNTGQAGVRITRRGITGTAVPDGDVSPSAVNIRENYFRNCYGDGGITGENDGGLLINIHSNYFRLQGKQAIGINGVKTPADPRRSIVNVTNNQIAGVYANSVLSASTQGFGISISDQVSEVLVSDNNIFGVYGGDRAAGIYLKSLDAASGGSENIKITDNVIENIVQTNGGRDAGIYVNCGDDGSTNAEAAYYYGLSIDNNNILEVTVGVMFELGARLANDFARTSFDIVSINSNLIDCKEMGVLTADPIPGHKPLGLVTINDNTISYNFSGAAFRGVRVFAERGQIAANNIEGVGDANSVGIELLDDFQGAGGVEPTDIYKFVNNNAIWDVGTDVVFPGDAIPVHQMSYGYEWFQDGVNFKHRNNPVKPAGLISGDVTGTET